MAAVSLENERVARLEEKIEAVHQDLHMIGGTFNRVWDTIEGLRRDLIGRPSWTVATLLAFMSTLVVALVGALVMVLVAR